MLILQWCNILPISQMKKLGLIEVKQVSYVTVCKWQGWDSLRTVCPWISALSTQYAVPGLLPSCRHCSLCKGLVPSSCSGISWGTSTQQGFKRHPAPDSELRLLSLITSGFKNYKPQKSEKCKMRFHSLVSLMTYWFKNLLYLLSYACPWDLEHWEQRFKMLKGYFL